MCTSHDLSICGKVCNYGGMPNTYISGHWGRTVNKIVLLRKIDKFIRRNDPSISLGWTPSAAPRAADDVAGPREAGSVALKWNLSNGESVDYPLLPDELDAVIDKLKTARREAFPAHVAARKVKRRLERQARKLGEKAGKRWEKSASEVIERRIAEITSVETIFRAAFPSLYREDESEDGLIDPDEGVTFVPPGEVRGYTSDEMRSWTTPAYRDELVMVAADEEDPHTYWHRSDNTFKPYPPVFPHDERDCDATPFRNLVCPNCGWRALGIVGWERTIENPSGIPKTTWRITKYPT